MEIEEVEQSDKSINFSDSQKEEQLVLFESDKIVEANVQKLKRKKRVKVIWHPKIPKKLLNLDTEPTYIYFLLRLFKSYDDIEYNRHRCFGYADAGVGMIEQVQLDKIYETVDFNLQIFSQGIDNFKPLIKLYKGQQDLTYYNLATVLEEYQKWTNEHLSFIIKVFSDKQKFSDTFQDELDAALPEFDLAVKQWAQETFPNELYQLELGIVKINQAKPTIKKMIFSKNLMMFIGGDLYEIYQKLIELNLKESFYNFLSGGEYNGKLQLEKTIMMIKWMMSGINKDQIIIEDEVFTLDGISIPTYKTIKSYYYNYKEKKVTDTPQLHFILATHYNFEPHWIKYLIEVRQTFQQMPKQIQYDGAQDNNQFYGYKDFEYICKQEYFLEKFDYINKYKSK